MYFKTSFLPIGCLYPFIKQNVRNFNYSYLHDLLSPADNLRSQKRIFGFVDKTNFPVSPWQGANEVAGTNPSTRQFKLYLVPGNLKVRPNTYI